MKTIMLAVVVALFLVLGVGAYTQLTLFVIPPIGAVPEGRVVIVNRMEDMKFIDSPDAMCERDTGGVSLMCRGGTMAAVKEDSDLFIRLPYSEWLDSLSAN